jgi:hypothetical protein
MSSWLAMTGILTTANALWLPEKRAASFQNDEDSSDSCKYFLNTRKGSPILTVGL